MDPFSKVKELFEHCYTNEEKYKKILELGRTLPPMKKKFQIKENIVEGCQSIVYLHTEMHDHLLFFSAASDALISKGLAALLINAYNEKPAQEVIKQKPTFLEELGITTSLTPGRSNGIANMYLRMQKEAIKFLLSH